MKHQQPYFSIVIPTYNRPEQLARCLESLTRLDYPRQDFEVIVVDDGSTTPLEPIVTRYKLNLTLIHQANSGPAAARNTGVKRAKGKYLAFTDDDCTPAPDWLTTLADRFATAPNCMIGGQTLNALRQNPYSTASQLLVDYLYIFHQTSLPQLHFFTSNNMSLPTEMFRNLGGFDTTFTLAAAEDRELCDRWLHYGYEMIYAPEVQIYHAHQLTLASFWRQQFNYGRGAFNFQVCRSSRTREKTKVNPLKFLFNLLTYPFWQNLQKFEHPAILLTLLLFVSQVAAIAGLFRETFSRNSFRNLDFSLFVPDK
ncbi:glycosyltransferase family 2 protein [Chroococcidiopsis sp. TS-821]|uniref:glycosyltransferase n=1 Tax=Chroococcidiopsis sp. TS-821 TaxID=1378066 RepID=UPI000CEDD138|nr:glycosyltransferase [Chroococcidiopsis sp. TS-821]PPS43915.1 glycosyl transferase [Chroococcidiopsis sp. TS-821]